MIEIERRALYNLLRMKWLMDSSVNAEEWEVIDYRSLIQKDLFDMLEQEGIELDKPSFITFAENFDTPEDLTEQLIGESDLNDKEKDHIYLLLFELWRRLVPEKPCLSVFCDELDHQIYLYDSDEIDDVEAIEDIIANLKVVLDENVDEGIEPQEAFEMVSSACANDIECFLYDFTLEQVDNQNDSYTGELLDAFSSYVDDPKWFAFLRVKLIALSDSSSANQYIRHLLKKTRDGNDLAFNLEVLSFLIQSGDRDVFADLIKRSIPLLEVEEDFQELLIICAGYYRCLDRDNQEKAFQDILDRRASNVLDDVINPKDSHIVELLSIIG